MASLTSADDWPFATAPFNPNCDDEQGADAERSNTHHDLHCGAVGLVSRVGLVGWPDLAT